MKLLPPEQLRRNLSELLHATENTLNASIAARRVGDTARARSLLYYAGRHLETAQRIVGHLERIQP